MGIKISHRGDFSKSYKFLANLLRIDYEKTLHHYGEMGVEALRAATPYDSGETASCWTYHIFRNDSTNTIGISWDNTHVERYINIAIILQYGHATRNGGYVQGRDYINPAMQPIFDQLAEVAWKEVLK